MPVFTASGLSVAVSGGKARLPDGSTLTFAGKTLNFAAPEIRSNTLTAAAPVNYATTLGSDTQSWFAAMPLVPAEAHPFRGGLWHGVIPNSVVVRSGDNSRTFVAGTDYRLNTEWGQVANIETGSARRARASCPSATGTSPSGWTWSNCCRTGS
jgi:hypothetical protein